MQPNQLVLPVDHQNDGTTTNEIYSRYEEFQNRSTYIGSIHVPAARDMFQMYRSFATKSGNFNGVSKTSFKFTKDTTVAGVDGVSSLTVPVIIEVNFSLPVGVNAAVVKSARQRVLACLDDDSIMDPLNLQLMV